MKVAEDLTRIASKDQGRPRKNVTILGAGMAGLVAAFELEALGHNVRILEGSGRVGGRVFTHTFSDGTYGELGAMRIPGIHRYVRWYIAKLNLKLRKFVSTHGNLNCFYDIRGVQSRMHDAKNTIYPKFRLSASEVKHPVAPAIFDHYLQELIDSLTDEEIRQLSHGELTTDRLRDLDRTSLGQYLDQRGGDEDKELIGATTGLEPLWDRAVTVFLREQALKPWEVMDEIVGGMSLLPLGLEKELKKTSLCLHKRVVGIYPRGDGRIDIAVSSSGASPQIETCDVVLCTLPFSVLRQIEITPPLSATKMQTIRTMSYASATKVLLHCRERFWESNYGIYGGASQSDQVIRATYYPSDHHMETGVSEHAGWWGGQKCMQIAASGAVAASSPGVLVGTYNWEQEARRLGAVRGKLPSDPPGVISPRARTVIKFIKRFHPEIDDFVDDEVSMFWDENTFSAGAYAFFRPGDRINLHKDARSPEGNLHFAGEHTSLDHAWMEGAVTSALLAVEDIVGS